MENIPACDGEYFVNVQLYSEDGLSGEVAGRMREYGWTIGITKIPKEVWTRDEHGIEF